MRIENTVVVIDRCHWPCCETQVETLHDYRDLVVLQLFLAWRRILCPEHLKQGFAKLDEITKEINAMGTL